MPDSSSTSSLMSRKATVVLDRATAPIRDRADTYICIATSDASLEIQRTRRPERIAAADKKTTEGCFHEKQWYPVAKN